MSAFKFKISDLPQFSCNEISSTDLFLVSDVFVSADISSDYRYNVSKKLDFNTLMQYIATQVLSSTTLSSSIGKAIEVKVQEQIAILDGGTSSEQAVALDGGTSEI